MKNQGERKTLSPLSGILTHGLVSRALGFLALIGLESSFLVGPAFADPSNKLLTIGTSQEFDSLNQLVTTASAAHYLAHFTNRSLVQVNADWKWECHLCTEIPTRENGLVKIVEEGGRKKLLATWKIKPEAVWSDGTPVTAKDFKFTWKVGLDNNVSVGERESYERVEDIVLDDKDPKSFVMKFKEVRYDYYYLSAFYVMPSHIEEPIYNKHKSQLGAYEKNSAFVADPTRVGLSNGPYMVKEIKLGSHVTFIKNPKWYGKPASIETITVKLIPNTQTLEANLVSGTIDMINELGLSFDQAVALEKRLKGDPSLNKKFKVQFEDSIVYEHIELNLDNPILSDLQVRKALMHSLDRK
jgi:peptide/nickel transport system substrate-binding protein